MIAVPMSVAAATAGIQMGVGALGVGVEMEVNAAGGDVPAYTGPYSVTPNSERQVLETAGTKMVEDVIIEPIPDNYGLITWNGSTLTVS